MAYIEPLSLLTNDENELKILRIKSRLMMKIAEYKLVTGITQKELAELCKVSQPRMSNVLKGHFSKVSIDELIRLNLRLNTGFKLKDLAEI